jgi:hypothetical protein
MPAMRIPIALVLVAAVALVASVATAATPCAAPPSAALLLRAHPGAWRLPARPATFAAGMRVEPENGAPAEAYAPAHADAAGSVESSARARAAASIRVGPDGTAHAILGDAFRAYTVVSIDAAGRVVQTCVHSRAEAERLVRAAPAVTKASGAKPAER